VDVVRDVLGGLVHVSAQNVFSQCDVLSQMGGATFNDAYGRGAASDVEITVGGAPLLEAEALDFEIEAEGVNPGPTWAAATCDVAELELAGPPATVYKCPIPNAAIPGVLVTVVQNEEWGPIVNAAGQETYGGAALHVTISVPLVATIDVYVGYAAVAVGGGPGPLVFAPEPARLTVPTACVAGACV
jgi:hypothetical protein